MMQWRVRLVGANETVAKLSLTIFTESNTPVRLHGTFDGPHCPYARTLLADYDWKPHTRSAKADSQFHTFVADIPDPCLWEPIHPFLYLGSWQLSEPGSESHPLSFGCRILTFSHGKLTLNSEPYFLRGMSTSANMSEDRLQDLVNWKCRCILNESPNDLIAADKFGPFVATMLPQDHEQAMQTIASAGPTRPSLAIWMTDANWSPEQFKKLLTLDRSILIGQRFDAAKAPKSGLADFICLEGSQQEIEAAAKEMTSPWIALHKNENRRDFTSQDEWTEKGELLDQWFTRMAGCIGWISA